MELTGHEVRLAHDGQKSIELAREFAPAVVLLDIGLPAMNGYEVCRLMRDEPVLKNTVFIAQTGWGQQEHRERSKAAGFDHHLVKPIHMPKLQELITSIAENVDAVAAR